MAPSKKQQPQLEVFEAVELIKPHIVRIATPNGFGTGFLFIRVENGVPIAIATAAHVVQHAWEWGEPIRLFHPESGETVLLPKEDRFIFNDADRDAAAIVSWSDFEFLPPTPLELLDQTLHLKVGVRIGWLGFPGSLSGGAELCYFDGRISAYLGDRETYLVDGVAIHGVSGGPAFCIMENKVMIIGIVSAYVPNRQTGESLPGLMMLKTLDHLHYVSGVMTSSKDAQEKESEQIAEQLGEGGESTSGRGS